MKIAGITFDLPNGWKIARCEDIIDVRDGTHDTPKYISSGYPLVTSKNLKPDGIDFSTVSYISEKDHFEISKRSKVDRGDILFAMIGTIGNPVIVDVDTQFSIKNVALFKFSESSIDAKYFKYLLETPLIKRQLNSEQRGGTQQFVSLKVLRNMLIPYPTPQEQRRIAAILDKADAVRRKRKEAIALTEELLRSAFLDMFGDPVTNPKGWEVLPMHEVIQTIEAGWSANGEDRRCESDEWGVLKISAVTSGRFQVNEHKVVEELLPNKSLIIPSKGDLLFSRANTRELVAATCLVDKNCERLFLPDKLWRIQPKPKFANTEYLKFLLSNPKYRSLIARKATGTSGSMLNVSQAKLLEMYAPIPPLKMQKCFAELVWQTFGMGEQYKLATIEANSMFNSLLQRAFRGEL